MICLSCAFVVGCTTMNKPEMVKAKTIKTGKISKQEKIASAPKGSVKYKVLHYAQKMGVPKKLAVAIAQQESGMKCHVIGGAGEIGPLQIKYPSAKMLGYTGGYKSLRNNCDLQIRWGMQHLLVAYKRSNHSLWATAYRHNSGPYAKFLTLKGAKTYANQVMARM